MQYTSPDLDFDGLSRELVRAIRGPQSQRAASRRLGYETNVLYTWESGTRWPTASEVLRFARLKGIDVQARLPHFLRVEGPWETAEGDLVKRTLQIVRGDGTIRALASRSGLSRFTLSRWLQGRGEPRLPDFLRLIEIGTLRVVDLLADLVGADAVPSATSRWRELEARRNMAWTLPWSHAVLRALELADYQRLPTHLPGWIARRLKIDRVEEARCLEALELAGLVAWHTDRYRVTEATVDTGTPAPDGARVALKRHWHLVAEDHLGREAEGYFSYNLFTVSSADLRQLRRNHVAYFDEMRRVVAASEPGDHVMLMQLHLFELGG